MPIGASIVEMMKPLERTRVENSRAIMRDNLWKFMKNAPQLFF
jgi:hypothetical protein